MNKRKRKKAEAKKRKLIHELLDMALDINGIQMSNKELTGDHPTAFFEFSGHIASVRVDVHEKGWDKNSKDYFYEFSSILQENEMGLLLKKLRRARKDGRI